VQINNVTVLDNSDIYAETGARYKATIREFTATANSSGKIVIEFIAVNEMIMRQSRGLRLYAERLPYHCLIFITREYFVPAVYEQVTRLTRNRTYRLLTKK
jgi:hypothetical protein